MVDIAVAFYCLPSGAGRKVGVIGGSGGTSVLAADICEEAGLNVIPLPSDIRHSLRESGNPLWDWISNPVDFSISMGDRGNAASIAELMGKHAEFQTLISFMRGPWQPNRDSFDLDKHMRSSLHHITDKPLITVFGNRPKSRGKATDEVTSIWGLIQQRLVDEKLATYPNIMRAANALDKMLAFYENRQKRGN